MNSELYKLLMANGDLDDDFIYKVFDILMADEESLYSYVNDFAIDNTSVGTALYDLDSKRISINEKGILSLSSVKNKKMLALVALRNQIEHAKNLKRLHEGIDDIETVLIRYSLVDYARSKGLYPITSFDQIDPMVMAFRKCESSYYNPEKRIAYIRAWKYLVNLLKNQRTSEDLMVARANLYNAYMHGYNNNGWYVEPPTYEYLLRMKMLDEYRSLKRRVEQRQYVFDTRLLYGLPLIDEKEYDGRILEKVRLDKRKQTK